MDKYKKAISAVESIIRIEDKTGYSQFKLRADRVDYCIVREDHAVKETPHTWGATSADHPLFKQNPSY